jgi:hypothetical protein
VADIELELLSRAIMTGGIDQLIAAGIEERHWFDPDVRAVFKTCVDHYATWRKPLSLEGVKRRHPDYRVVPVSDDLGYLIQEFGRRPRRQDRHLGRARHPRADREGRDGRPRGASRLRPRFMEIARRVAAEAPGEKVSRLSDMSERLALIRRQQDSGVLPGVPTGIPPSTPTCARSRLGDFFVHCGFSGRGKTQSLARSSVQAYAAGDVVLMNSLEMSPDEIWEIYDAEAAKLSRRAIQPPRPLRGRLRALRAGGRSRAPAQNDIVYVRVETVDKLAAMVERYGAQTVCVDYVSLMDSQLRARADWERVKEVSQSLKRLAGT